MTSAIDIVFNAGIGAGSAFVATKCLAWGGLAVATPPVGALYGALFITTITNIHIKTDSTIGKIASFAAKFIIATATAVALCHLYGAAFTLTNAAILSTATLCLSVVTALAIIKLIENGYLNFGGLSVQNLTN